MRDMRDSCARRARPRFGKDCNLATGGKPDVPDTEIQSLCF
nr:MAG TPA: hypothetical protein [Caudoviricetes sp.]